MPLLSITIPTYNRAKYLELCLNSLVDALPADYISNIEIIVLNNSSTDNTEDIILKAKKRLDLIYIKNNINIGPDENFKKCIDVANGRYVWIFGDDDIFFKNSIQYILNLLKKSSQIGLIHLKAKNFQEDKEILNYSIKKPTYIEYTISSEFIKSVHTNITFISANIFNKSLLNNIQLNNIPNNNLGQVYWNLLVAIRGLTNIYVNCNIFAARQFNSANYEFCEVFGKNFIEILDLMEEKYNIRPLTIIIKKRLLCFYYPMNIMRLKSNKSKVQYSNNCFKILFAYFKFEKCFWIFTVLFIFMPHFFTKFLLILIDKLRYIKDSNK